jgi:propanediol dehydratase small subunit
LSFLRSTYSVAASRTKAAQIFADAGRDRLAMNFERAAELTAVPDDRILEIYNALRLVAQHVFQRKVVQRFIGGGFHPFRVLIRQRVVADRLAMNFERAAELTAVPDDRILEIYNALRPYRSTKYQCLLYIASHAPVINRRP